jgi:hypothetical protein
MTRHTVSVQPVEKIDLVWSRIKAEAEEIIHNDPSSIMTVLKKPLCIGWRSVSAPPI